nr:kunitz-type serine protease inhibitor cvp2-like [Drosophila takahashii]
MNSKLIVIAMLFVAFWNLTIAYNKEKCDAPPSESGYCMADLPRWVYKNKKCQPFPYGGCGGTPNLFLFKYQCEVACDVPKTENHPYMGKPCTKCG